MNVTKLAHSMNIFQHYDAYAPIFYTDGRIVVVVNVTNVEHQQILHMYEWDMIPLQNKPYQLWKCSTY